MNKITLLFLVAFSASLSAEVDPVTGIDTGFPFAYPSAPFHQPAAEAEKKSEGCISCHEDSDSKNMHSNPSVQLGCVDCHGGDESVFLENKELSPDHPAYVKKRNEAHVMPDLPERWNFPSSANPEQSYTLLNDESPDYIRFVNPGDYRVARASCGACHLEIIEATARSLMSTGAMLWGGASYNNGILPFKNYILGEGYMPNGNAAVVTGPSLKYPDEAKLKHGVLPQLAPLPSFESAPPGDIFRVFEDGGRLQGNMNPEVGNFNLGNIQALQEPGRPDLKASNRGKGTGGRISVPVLTVHKSRLNDPFMWFMGTNEQPGDFRSSGCSGCHVVYANDRDPLHSGQWAKFGHRGKSQTVDPTISKDEMGHPLYHRFTRAIPTSQCIVCHMHQPNMFMNTYMGFIMWDYESDAPFMWPKEQINPSAERSRWCNNRNPEGAVTRGKWCDPEFLAKVSELNPQLNDTQFADYHGHGWNFRAIFKRDRKGNLLDEEGDIVSNDDPDKFQKAVHMASIHMEKGMHCVDCHFAQDSHGNGHIYGEVANAIEIDCVDCHGTIREYPNLITSGPAAPPRGNDLSLLRNPDGKKRFEWIDGKLIQRSLVNPGMEWEMTLVKDTVNPDHPDYNKKAARAKLMSNDTEKQNWGQDVPDSKLAHNDDNIECYTCHMSWTTSCGGCHLPTESNWKTDRHHYESGDARMYATYNPQVARDQMFLIGRRGPINGGRIAPVRSSSALTVSSRNANREHVYVQQPPIAASGYSSQAFNPHFPHTARKTETKTCDDCHLSKDNDNNAIMAQLLMHGTNFINFIGYNAYLGLENGVAGIQVTEWPEPQAVIGSYLHKYAYPDWWKQHQERGKELQEAHYHSGGKGSCVQHRGEYLYTSQGKNGFQVFDIASIANKGVSQRITTGPTSEKGQNLNVPSFNATCMAIPTNQPIHPDRNQGDLMRVTNQELPFHPIYNYAFITDEKEGLILTDVNTLADGDMTNNFLTRQLTWNEGGVLDGARHITIGGYYVYITTDHSVVILNMDDPMKPKVVKEIELKNPEATALQFRYLFVVDADGLKAINVTTPEEAFVVPDNTIPLKEGHRIYLARTYAYVAAGSEGLAIVDIEKAEDMKLYQMFTAEGAIKDARDVVVATTNATLIGYIADGEAGLKVLQLTSPDSQPNFYGFSPEPKPELIAWYKTSSPALALSKGLDRDRGVDETGGQIAIFGRLGSRPLSLEEQRKLYLDKDGKPWYVTREQD